MPSSRVPSLRARTRPRRHVDDPALGIDVEVNRTGVPPHRLVTIGDSITQGFMSGAIFRTDRSWPTIVAHELGLTPQQDFRYPVFEPPSGPGGVPLDLERFVRGLQRVVGDRLDWFEIVKAGRWVRSYMDSVEDYWERGGYKPEAPDAPFHNLSVYGADLVDVQALTERIVTARINIDPRDNLLRQIAENANDRVWQAVLASTGGQDQTILDAAERLGNDGDGPHGIETLVVMLGANHALGSVVSLDARWTTDAYGATKSLDDRLEAKREFNVWHPTHFADEWHRLVERIKRVRARHVIVATVPQVTIAPIARGVKGKRDHGSRFFPYYTRPWISDDDFDLERDPWIDGREAQRIDTAIDRYNANIIESVRNIRRDPNDPRDWYIFDLGALLDRMAHKRYITDPGTQPSWWRPYELPANVDALEPRVDSRFFSSSPSGRIQGGLFSLDGVHPTTIGAGIVAREIIRIMDTRANVVFHDRSGTPRNTGVDVDFERVIALDTLNSEPPSNLASTLSLLGWADEQLDWIRNIV